MLTFPRSAARWLRILARKSISGRPRGPAPSVLATPGELGVTLAVALDEVIVALNVPTPTKLKAPWLLPMAILDAVEGAEDDPVEVVPASKQAASVRWTERGVPRSQDFELPDPKGRFNVPPRPESLTPVPSEFLTALHEAGRQTAREVHRYALNRVQVRGKAGEVIGTDSRVVYRHGGFTLPFSKDLLVPAVPVFGLKDLAQAGDIHVGCDETHFIVAAGEATVFLKLDQEGGFPDVASVIPKSPAPATLTVDGDDALMLLDALPSLPGNDDDRQPVTLDLDAGVGGIVRAKTDGSKEIVEVRLSRSSVSRGPIRIALERDYLRRMLVLGCRTIRVHTTERPIVAIGGPITLIAMPLDETAIVKPSPHARVLTPESTSLTPRSPAMKSDPSANGHLDQTESTDLFTEAEALRNALTEAQNRLGRLLGTLRSKKKEQKALSQVWSSLKSLNLGG